MIDLHTHSIFSDGVLIPSELVRRAEVCGYTAIGITDHVDASNIDFVVPRIVLAASSLNRVNSIQLIPGVELTHVPPAQIRQLAEQARFLGARLVVVHGETIAEPVMPGTNQAALEAPIDILAHPGLISEQDVKTAAKKGVFLEVSARKGHSLTNGHVVNLARNFGAQLVLDSDGHEPQDLLTSQWALRVALGAGCTEAGFQRMQENARSILLRSSRNEI